MTATTRQHWDTLYATKTESEVSWYQPYPAASLEMLAHAALAPSANIIDVGGGDSHLVDVLLEQGYENLWVLDISANALARTRQRLGDRASDVHWVASDVLEFDPPVPFDLWHDRAAFHFLTTEAEIERYVALAERGIHPGGYLVLGTFAEDGPGKCSGLPVQQYNAQAMAATFRRSFECLHCLETGHETPFHTVQPFVFCIFRRR